MRGIINKLRAAIQPNNIPNNARQLLHQIRPIKAYLL